MCEIVPGKRGVVSWTKGRKALQCVFRIPLPHKGAEISSLLCAALRKRTAETQKEDFLCIHIPFPPITGGTPPEN